MASPIARWRPARDWADLDYPIWRPLIALAVVPAAAFVGTRPSIGLLGGLLAVCAIPILVRWPALGLVALVATSLVVNLVVGTGTQSNLNAPMLLLGSLAGLQVARAILQRDLRFLTSRATVALLALVAASVFSFALANQPLIPFARTAPMQTQLAEVAIFALSAAAFILASQQLRDPRWLAWVTWVFLGLGALYVATWLVPRFGQLVGVRFPWGVDGSLFWTWLVALAFSQSIYNKSARWPVRLALFGLVLGCLYITLFRQMSWLSGWLPALVGMGIIVAVGSPRLWILVAVLGGAFLVANEQGVIAEVMGGDNAYSLSTRLEAWSILEEIVKISPLLGVGPANYYWYTPLFSLNGYHLRFNSHNNYVDLVAQTGLIGLACFLWFAWEMGRAGWRMHRMRRGEITGFERAYVLGALGGLGGTLVAGMLGDWVIPFVYNVGFPGFRASVLGWIFLGGLLALERREHARSSGEGEAT